MMEIRLHGGHCCGIKTICHFPSTPSAVQWGKGETSKDYLSSDRDGLDDYPSDYNFFWEEAPKETAEERFDRLLRYLERVRHFGLVECAIVVPTDGVDSLHGYTAEQLERGEIASYAEAVIQAQDVEEDEWGYVDSDFEEGGGRVGFQAEWVPVFEARGFKEVSRFPNVNSGNEVAVFHLVMNGDYYKAKKKE